jgi:hypothetical protein
MAIESILLIIPDSSEHVRYKSELSAAGYSVAAVCSLDEARVQLLLHSFGAIVFDIDKQGSGAMVAAIASIQPRNMASLLILGSPHALAQLLAEFSQHPDEYVAALGADALVIKHDDLSELRFGLKDLFEQRKDFGEIQGLAISA